MSSDRPSMSQSRASSAEYQAKGEAMVRALIVMITCKVETSSWCRGSSDVRGDTHELKRPSISMPVDLI